MKGEPKSFTEYFIDDTVEKDYNEATAFLQRLHADPQTLLLFYWNESNKCYL